MSVKITFPTDFEHKTMVLENPKNAPAELNITIPSLTKPNEPFKIKIAVYDTNGFPSTQCEETLVIVSEQIESMRFEVPMEKERIAVAAIDEVTIEKEGFYRFTGKLDGKRFHSNPTWCSRANKEQIFWGDPHIHTNLSNCGPTRARSLNYCFTAAKHSTRLDWASAADHVSNGRCEFAKWKEQVAVSNLYDEPGVFVTLPAYEASLAGGKGGDNNVYMTRFPDMFVDMNDDGNVCALVDGLKKKLPESDFFVVPHHTTRTGKHGEISNAIYPGESMMPVVEIHSKWGTSEYRGNPNHLLEVHDGPSYVVDLLNQGLPLGFVGGTDSHTSLTTVRSTDLESRLLGNWYGMTAVFAEKLDRDSIFNAIKTRHCYAASRDRTLILGTVNDQPFGTEIERSSSSVNIKARIAGKEKIAIIDLVRNGIVHHTVRPDTWHVEFEFTDDIDFETIAMHSKFIGKFVYYYIRVSFDNDAQAWSSPAWITSRKHKIR